MLEMVAAATLMTAILVPALSVMRDAMANSRTINHRNVLSVNTGYYMEMYVALVPDYWATLSSYSTTFAVTSPDGYGNLRCSLDISDDPANGGIVGQLMNIQITTFDDLDNDLTLDTNEPRVTYRTKVAKLNSYDNEEI